MIFELGPNPCELLYHLNQSGVGLRHFFAFKIDSEILGTNKENSHHGASTLVCEKSHNGALSCTKMTNSPKYK